MFTNTKNITLPSKEKDIIVRDDWLTDIHMDHFGYLLQNYSDYRPVETWRVQCLDRIQPMPGDKKHIQILHSSSGPYDGHWVCSYYDKKNIFIYDSLNYKKLHKHHEQFLKRLFPTYDFKKHPVKFPTVQHQPNSNDCGVFAIAFAISLLFNIKPEKVTYDHSLMRSHLIKIFESNVIEHFPQDKRYTFQKILPLAVVKAREAEAIRISTIRQHKQQKFNRLEKVDNSHSEKKLHNNQLLILMDTPKEFIQITNDNNKISNIKEFIKLTNFKETNDIKEINIPKEFIQITNDNEKTNNIEEFIKTTNNIEKINDVKETDKYFQSKHYIKNYTGYKIIDNNNDLCSNNKISKNKIYQPIYPNKDSKNKCTKKRSRCEDTVQLEVINKKE